MENKNTNEAVSIKTRIQAYFADLYEIRDEMFERHPLILGHIEGCILVYWSVVIACFIMKIFFKRKLDWVKM